MSSWEEERLFVVVDGIKQMTNQDEKDLVIVPNRYIRVIKIKLKKKNQTFWCVYLFVIPGQRPSRVRQGPVVVHIGGVSVEVLTPAAVGL